MLFLGLLLPGISASEYPLLDEILTRMEDFRMEEYAYTQSREEEGKLTVEKYDPAIPGDFKWQLVLREGQQPTEKQHKKYRKDKVKELDRQQRQEEQSYSDLINPDSLILVEDTPGYAVYSFQAAAIDGNSFSRMMENVQGRLKINKEGRFLESLRMSTPEPFSPIIGVEIRSFQMQMIFSIVSSGETEAVLLAESHFSFSGTALLFKDLDQNVVIKYKDFIFRGPPVP